MNKPSLSLSATFSLSLVLDLPELLELILLNLPLPDLLSASLVCHNWKQLIEDSCRIQQALFLRPTPITATQCANAQAFESANTNTTVHHLTGVIPAAQKQASTPPNQTRQSISTGDATINPILSEIFQNSILPHARFGTRHGFLQASSAVVVSTSDKWARCPPAWRKMYALQPPSPAMSIGTCRGWWGWEFDDLREPEGVTVEHVLEWLGSNGLKLRKGFIVMSCPPPKEEQNEI